MISTWPYYSKDEIEATSYILNSGKVNYWTGKVTKTFEEEFSSYCNVSYSIAIANGSLALSAAYKSLDFQKDDELITTPRTFIATTSEAVRNGIKPIFADVDLNSGCITAETIEPLINKKTKGISVVHLGGWPADILKIKDLADTYSLKLVEDCSQAHGGGYFVDGVFKSVGYLSDVATWSFCQDKIISTGGEGGMVTTNSSDLYKKIWSLKDHGKNSGKIINTPSSNSFRLIHDEIGTNFRLTEIQSAIGRIQLKKLDYWNFLRKRNATIIYEELKEIKLLRIPKPPDNIRHAWYKFYTYIDKKFLSDGWTRDRIVSEINLSGFPAYSGSCGEIYLEKCFQSLGLQPFQRLKNAKELGETSLMFLVHPTLTEEEMQDYTNTIKKTLKLAMK